MARRGWNISEGYCRRSLKEYLNHLNIALGSCGEFHSCYESFKQAGQKTHPSNIPIFHHSNKKPPTVSGQGFFVELKLLTNPIRRTVRVDETERMCFQK